MKLNPLLLWGVVALVAMGLIFFGILTLTTNLLTAVGIALIVVGIAKLFQLGSNPTIGFLLMGAGGALWALNGLTELTIGDVASFAGWTR